MRRLITRRQYPLHFQKDRMGGARCDMPRLMVE
jgi:hypothetical protein